MKKMLLMVAVVATVGLTSCGGADICDCQTEEEMKSDACKDLAKEWEEKMKAAESDEDKEKLMKEMTEAASKCEKKDEEKEEK